MADLQGREQGPGPGATSLLSFPREQCLEKQQSGRTHPFTALVASLNTEREDAERAATFLFPKATKNYKKKLSLLLYVRRVSRAVLGQSFEPMNLGLVFEHLHS